MGDVKTMAARAWIALSRAEHEKRQAGRRETRVGDWLDELEHSEQVAAGGKQ